MIFRERSNVSFYNLFLKRRYAALHVTHRYHKPFTFDIFLRPPQASSGTKPDSLKHQCDTSQFTRQYTRMVFSMILPKAREGGLATKAFYPRLHSTSESHNTHARHFRWRRASFIVTSSLEPSAALHASAIVNPH